MRFNDIIGAVSEWPLFAIKITENSNKKSVRVIGVLAYAVAFLPLILFWFVVVGLLAIPAMIQDA